MKQKTILITGATGMIGSSLYSRLLQKGYRVNTLSRQTIKEPGINSFKWNVEDRKIQEEAVISANMIIHLAGENIASGRWTMKRKKEILESRIASTELILDVLKKHHHRLDMYLGASATGFYGDRGNELLHENSASQACFLSDVCTQWEEKHHEIADYSKRLIIYRFGVVLDATQGAFPEMMKTLPFFLTYFGNGRQIMPIIHLRDLINALEFAIEKEDIEGIFNTVCPHPVSNKQFMQILSEYKHGILPLLPAPAFLLKMALGEMATIVLSSQNCSPEKLMNRGFQFEFENLNQIFDHQFKTIRLQ